MKKLLIIMLSFAPFFATAQDWFKVNAVRFSIDNKYSEWEQTNIDVFFADDMKIRIYAEETHTIRGVSEMEEHVDELGISRAFWLGVDEKGKDCVVCIESDQASYIHLVITFRDDNFVICYNLLPD